MGTMAPMQHRMKPNGKRDTAAAGECSAVAEAALALGLKEFDFFRLAYRRWFGRQPDEKLLEKDFAAYMFGRTVPTWVRHLGRQVIDQRRRGTLDAEAFGAGRYRDRVTRHPKGPMVFVGVMAIWLALFSMLLGTSYDPVASAAPQSCPGITGAHFYEAWAHTLAGKPAPPCHPGDR
jgi:hypothetical protein